MRESVKSDAPSADPPDAEGQVVKRSFLFPRELWDRIERSAEALAEQIQGEPDVPAFIRGAIRRRCDEVLGDAA